MKKVFLTAFIAAAFAFGMTACNNNKAAEETVDSAATEQVEEHQCDHHCTAEECAQCCGEECAAANCENCPKKAEGKCCKENGCVCNHEAEQKECCGNHEGCENHEGCKHECQH